MTLNRESAFPSIEDKERERQVKREAVLRTAAALFAERGYSATQMGDVAAMLGVTKPTIYYYFRNKEDVIFACFEAGFELIDEALRQNTQDGSMTGADRLRAVLTAYAKGMTQDFGRCTVRVTTAELSEEARRRVREQKRRIDGKVRLLVAEAVLDGSIGRCDPKIATFTILGSINGIAVWFRPEGDMTADDAAAAVVEQLFRGLDRRER